jgi:hypothetical protein
MYVHALRTLAFGGLLALALAARPANPPVNLGGPNRALTSISTDKPIYRGGERVYVRGVILDAFKHTPVVEWTQASIELRGPKGDIIVRGVTQPQDGTWSFAWDVPPGQAGGEYTIKASYPNNGHAPAERKFDVRAYRAPRLKTQITFLRDGYGPGDTVTATVEVTRAEGGIPSGAQVTATARVDGVEVARVPSTVDGAGHATATFQLPARIERGEGAIAFAIQDGGVVETATKTIPILLQTVDLALYPEGGDLVAGLSSRIYFEAHTPAGKPADLEGDVVDERTDAAVAHFRSEHEGRGRFEFRPQRGARYVLRLTQPAGITRTFPVPDSRREGALLRAMQDVVAPGQSAKFSVRAAPGQKLKLTLAQREVELASANFTGPEATITMDPKDAAGVLTATLWSESGEPLAERLVLRRPSHPLDIQISADHQRSAPGSEVKLTIKTSVNQKPVPAWVGLTVTDDSVLQLIEKREQAPTLPAMALLEPEVEELRDARVYFDPKNSKAALQTDLLLGTQGWRRLAMVDAQKFMAAHGDAAKRVLAYRFPVAQPVLMRKGANWGPGIPQMPMGGMAPGMGRANIPMAAPAPADPGVLREEAADDGFAQAMPANKKAMAEKPAEPEAPADEAANGARLMSEDEEIADGDVLMGKKDAPAQSRARREVAPRVLAYVREFSHQARPNRQANDRVDFAETLYWSAAVNTGANGETTVKFHLADSVTSFQAIASGYTASGDLGSGEAQVESVKPFYLEPKLPLEVSAGDQVQVPLALVNGTSASLGAARVTVQAGKLLQLQQEMGPISIRGGDRVRQLLAFNVSQGNGTQKIAFEGVAGNYTDRVERTLSVKPSGFPFEVAFGGMISPQKPAIHTVVIPEGVAEGSVEFAGSVYPTPLANMTQALSRLIQEPNGCFEQTSSTTYPMTMAQQYFLTHQGVDPQLVRAAREKLDTGYQRLVGFECSQKGYEWFGENPGHEALTAFGLLHFTDMSKVRQVDTAMMTNTRAWLMKQRDGNGGFERKRRALHTWIEDKDSSNAYITWAMLETGGVGELSKEVRAVEDAGQKTPNAYVTALAANVAWLGGHKDLARSMMSKLASQQAKDGSVTGGTQSIVGSGGEALLVETTSLATLAWLREPSFSGNVERSIKYLAEVCQGGRYGSTQSTVLALRAIVAYDQARAHPKKSGTLRLLVDGKVVGTPARFDADTKGAIALPDAAPFLTRGKHELRLQMDDGSEMPYSMTIHYHALTPDSSKRTKVSMELGASRADVTEGELVDVIATVSNKTQEQLPTVVALVGLPGGLEPRHDQLKELVKKGAIDAYEVKGRDVVLYWRGMEPGASNRVPLSLVAAVPGRYTGPASRAYLYYTDEDKVWLKGLQVTVAPKR